VVILVLYLQPDAVTQSTPTGLIQTVLLAILVGPAKAPALAVKQAKDPGRLISWHSG